MRFAAPHPTCTQIYATGQESMAAMNATAPASNSTNSTTETTGTRTRSTGSPSALQQQAQQLAGNTAQQVGTADSAAGAQPAADCITACEAYNSALVCFTAGNQIRLCTTSGDSTTGASNSSLTGVGFGSLGSLDASTTADPTAEYQPAADCITLCEMLGDSWICYTADTQARDCLPTSAAAAGFGDFTAAGLSPTGAALGATPTGGISSSQPAAQLGGQPLCSAQSIQGARGRPCCCRSACALHPSGPCHAKGVWCRPICAPQLTHCLSLLAGIATVQSCPAGYICASLSSQQLAAKFGGQLNVTAGELGVCAYAPQASSVRLLSRPTCCVFQQHAAGLARACHPFMH